MQWSDGAVELNFPYTEENFFVDWVRETRAGKEEALVAKRPEKLQSWAKKRFEHVFSAHFYGE